ncbi:hypothetical protein LXL04_011312 [Taraxacum kok-saghyz]
MASETKKQSLFPTDREEIKVIFNRFDTNGDGSISEEELIGVLKSLGSDTSPDEVKRIMKEIDTDSDGSISLDEFVGFCKGIAGDSEDEDLKETFKLYDQDNNGKISASELHQILSRLGEMYTIENCKDMIKSVDADGDGHVDFEEFKKMILSARLGIWRLKHRCVVGWLTCTAPSKPNSSKTPENQSRNFTGKYRGTMGTSNALFNLQLNTNNCVNCMRSRTNHSNSLQINQNKTYLSLPNKRQKKVNRGVCFAFDDMRDLELKLGIIRDRPKVVEEIKEETPPETGGAMYNFLYPDKELLPEDKEMSLFDHLEELRGRLLVSVLAVGAAIIGCFAYSKELIMLLEAPVSSQGVRFLQLAPGEFFFTTIKVSGYCGILLGSPVILFEIIAFVLPGLTKSERKFLAPIVLGSSILFYAGIAFSYSVLVPAALNFFVTYAEGVVESLWSIDQYFEFVLVLMFSTGLSFQVPVIQLLLGQVGLVSGDQMLSIWRYVVVGAVVAAAIVTPSTDPLTQLLLAGPLLGLYFGGAWTVKFIGRYGNTIQLNNIFIETTSIRILHISLSTDYSSSNNLSLTFVACTTNYDRLK